MMMMSHAHNVNYASPHAHCRRGSIRGVDYVTLDKYWVSRAKGQRTRSKNKVI